MIQTASETDPLMARRAAIRTAANPHRKIDYLVALSGRIAVAGQPVRVRLRYVPDAAIVSPAVFDNYLSVLTAESWASLEQLAGTVLLDFANELVARWLELTFIAQRDPDDAGSEYAIRLEERQPQWKNDALLARAG